MRGLVRALPLVVLAVCGPATAQVDPGAPEGADHRAVQTVASLREFDRYSLPVGTFGLDAPAVREVEGAAAWSAWRLDLPARTEASGAPEGPEITVASVIRDYRERLQALGFETIFDCAGEACGGFDFRFGAEILPPPGMLVDVRDFAQLSVARAEPAAFVSVLVSRVLESIYVQTVSVAPAAAAAPEEPTAQAPAAAPSADEGPESGAAESGAEEAGEAASPADPSTGAEVPDAPAAAPPEAVAPTSPEEGGLAARLSSAGHVSVQGLDFETGGAALSPGSAAALDGLAALLSGEGAPGVIVVGHSDNQGGLELNIELSRRRAETVRQALIARGVPAERLEARGVGFLAPIASNATEAGRALNRRVELVLR